jgi:non-specific serine/threonine protein kinase/serine/threonine-protein kinase
MNWDSNDERTLTPEAWATITELFGRAMELRPDERTAFLARLELENPAIARELAWLLEEHDRPGEFLSPVDVSAPLITDLSGTSVGEYLLVRLLGNGGMGAVYLGERSDGAFSKQVAIKLLSPAFFHAQERFQQEREFLARLDHPNITRLLDGGTTPGGMPYLVVEHVEGAAIDRYCAERDLSLDDRLRLLLQVCAAIAHAHQHLIIHSDIKPENILVTRDGSVKVLDFGIATLRDAARSMHRPATPAYSSPEQLSGGAITTASDVYAIGVLAYELLAESPPYALRSDRLDEILRAVLTADPIRASLAPGVLPARARQLRGDLDAILGRAVAKEPTKRYATAQQLADDVERYRAGLPVRARPDTIPYRFRKFIGRYRLASGLAALTAVCLVAGIAISMWQARVARRRFEDLRQFAHAVVFDVNDSLSTIPGTTATRKLVVETALQYLDRLAGQNLSDPQLREELAAAYLRIGNVQGGAFLANLGDSGGAMESFRKAIAVADSGVTPGLERVAIEAHIATAFLARDPIQSLPDFDAAIRSAGSQLAAHPDDAGMLRLITDASGGRATVDHITDRVGDEERDSTSEIAFSQRALKIAPTWRNELALCEAMAQHALAREQTADYGGALEELRQVGSMLESLAQRNPGNQVIARSLSDKRSRAGSVLVAMGRPEEAATMLETGMALLTPLVSADPRNAQYRGDLAYTWYRLGEAMRAQGDITRALELHRKALVVRRERVERDPGFTFIRWELSRSLNATGTLLLVARPPDPAAAASLFAEAQELAEKTLGSAPSFNELRKEIARAQEGLGRAALARVPPTPREARSHFEHSLHTWEEVVARGPEDRRDVGAPDRVRRSLASMGGH